MKKSDVMPAVESAIVESVRVWVNSPEGRAELERAVRQIRSSTKRWLSGRNVSDETMRRRITI